MAPPHSSLKNHRFFNEWGTAKIRALRHEFSDWLEFIFLRKRKRLLLKNAILAYMPPELIENEEA